MTRPAAPARRHHRSAGVAVAVAVCLVALAACGGGTPRTAAATSSSPAAVVTSASAGPSASPTPSADPCGPWGCAQRDRLATAARYVAGKPGYLGIIVRDRVTGAVWRAGVTDRAIWTASTVKLAMITGILERGRAGEVTVDAQARADMDAVLAISDNDAADRLWSRYGKDTQLSRFTGRYGMTGLRFVSGFPRYWGHMKCTDGDLDALMTYVLTKLDAADRSYLLEHMRRVGAIQQWGVWSAGADQSPGLKNGWSIEPDGGTRHWVVNSVGFAGPDARYAVSVMYHLPDNSDIGTGVHTVSDLVATVFGAATPAKVTVPDPSTGL